MRVIAGKARGRKLTAVPGRAVRPTSDRVKEAVFSMLDSRFGLDRACVLDLYAGSGALGIEALSRGAGGAVFVEQNAGAARVVRRNLAACGFASRVLETPARRALDRLAEEGARFDGVFLDPPYAGDEAAASLARLGEGTLLEEGAWVVVEHDGRGVLPDEVGVLGLISARRYGNTHVSVYARNARKGSDGN